LQLSFFGLNMQYQ